MAKILLAVVVIIGFVSHAELSYAHHGGGYHGGGYHGEGHHGGGSHGGGCNGEGHQGGSSPGGTTPGAPPTSSSGVETKSMDQLYADAKKEGCKAIIYAGGDVPGQQDYYKNLFEQKFKGCTLEIIVDYSKFHDARINYQLQNNKLIPDVVQLQTLQDFPIWKKENRLMSYKPKDWDVIMKDFKDPDGYFMPIFFSHFTNCVNNKLMKDPKTWPTNIKDYLKPELKGHIVLTYPNDDDAVLFLFKLFIDKYGWGFFEELNAKQNVTWVRGTEEPSVALAENRTWAAIAAGCDFNNPPGVSTFVLPKSDPFMTWAQTAAIFKDAKNPATAKLYLNWIVSADVQRNNLGSWSIRTDVPPPKPYGPLSSYKSQTNPLDFKTFMENRAAVEDLKTKMMLIIGEPKGPASPGNLGMYPTKALPH
ncbi:unnamed protein product [Allacma fusca]|uniref:Uncharacterized protein n=1 Tax=Allacma fusca TaxID=39272 RepID=A0A8J2NWK4_9HEXA|nr:unnamed protein product [Allacma fusca]